MDMMEISRRESLVRGGAVIGASTLTALGFSPAAAQSAVRPFKLERTTETRNTCPYCSVSCGLIMYSLGDRAKNIHGSIIHIEGDPDHPINRGTLCPKGAALMDFVHAAGRRCPLECEVLADQTARAKVGSTCQIHNSHRTSASHIASSGPLLRGARVLLE